MRPWVLGPCTQHITKEPLELDTVLAADLGPWVPGGGSGDEWDVGAQSVLQLLPLYCHNLIVLVAGAKREAVMVAPGTCMWPCGLSQPHA